MTLNEIGLGFGEPSGTPPPRIPRSTSPGKKDKIYIVSLTLRDCLSLSFQGMYIYLDTFFSFFIQFKRPKSYLDRATMRAKEFSSPLATARGHHASSLFLQTN